MPRKMTFEDALYELKLGRSVSRHIWGGLNQVYLFITPTEGVTVPHKYGGGFPVPAVIWCKTVDDQLMPYVATSGDLLSDDWQVVEHPERADQKVLRNA